MRQYSLFDVPKISAFLLLAVFLPLLLSAADITNISVAQRRDGSKKADISFDLSNVDSLVCIIVKVSLDNGSTFDTLDAQYLSGDLDYLNSGSGKSIVWDMGASHPDSYSSETILDVIPVVKPYAMDIDGNFYPAVKIGNQWWLTENLKVRNYRDGTAIPRVTDNTAWTQLSTGAYCYYDNDSSSYAETYGALYNWHAVNGDTDGDGIKDKEIAPAGWHVPTDEEWKELEMHLGMNQSIADLAGWRGTDEGKKLKSTSGWSSSGNGTDAVGFAALPGGYRSYVNGYFSSLGGNAYFWSASKDGTNYAWYRELYYGRDAIYRSYDYKENGFSLRCVQD